MQTWEDNKITSKFSENLNLTYDWFDSYFTDVLAETFFEFWNNSINIKLLSISENSNFLAQGEEYFVTQVRINKELSVFVKLSKFLVKNLLENFLGQTERSFDIEKITDLEAQILTGFDNLLCKNLCNLLKSADDIPSNNNNYNECNLTFCLQYNGNSLGKMVVKIPVVALSPEPLVTETETFTINNFLKNTAKVSICAGYSKIKLNDIKTLEKDDVVLLENSRIDQMILKQNGIQKAFRIVPNPLLKVDYDIDNDGENSGGNKTMSNNLYNMWDSIQVEIGAEFEKVKLTLGELKQISEGLIVDVGSIYDSKIDLKVDDKIVASGELVIINDRYGVKINETFAEEENEEVLNTELSETTDADDYDEEEVYEPETQDSEDTGINDDDFDYGNFDIDDEDL